MTERQRITSPRSQTRPRAPLAGPRTDVDEQTPLGEVYLRSLMRTQLRTSLFFFVGVLLVAAAVPLAFTLDPGLAELTVAGVPVPWIGLGVLAYPLLCLTGWAYVRAAERSEREFTEIMEERR